MEKYIVSIKLTILGPFLTAAASTETYGLDKAFYRNSANTPEIPGSHIKGKLRMSLAELKSASASVIPCDLDDLLGQPSASGSYAPSPGRLHFSSFVCDGVYSENDRTRTAINPITMTASESQLCTVEDLFPSGSSTEWKGSVTFLAADLADALQVASTLQLGFKWLTAMGAEKGVGSGRLNKVSISRPKLDQPDLELDLAKFASCQALHLQIQPVEHLMIGGVKKPRSNFVPSERIISGGVIKGALAASLNQAFGIQPSHLPISAETGQQMPGYELLAEYFDRIRVTHAFPSINVDKRPVKVPLSAVQVNGNYYDMALSQDAGLLIDEQAPLYSVDWKESWEYFDEAHPKEVFVTRTAIDNMTRRSNEGQLFTYTFLCPQDSDGRPVHWMCNVDFSAIEDVEIRKKVRDQFALAVCAHLDHLGKLNQPVTVKLLPNRVPLAVECQDLVHDNFVVVTLQTDAIMLDPGSVEKLAPGEDLKRLYADYWQNLCQQKGQAACMELVDFFTQQNFQGGYLYHRYLGGAQGSTENFYYPYYLTGAGSVFILRVANLDDAKACLTRWLERGLDLPAWAQEKYGRNGRALWQNCPFVPENGYGEIVVNLKWHWEKQAGLSPVENNPIGGEK